jgi:hypothetical protein
MQTAIKVNFYHIFYIIVYFAIVLVLRDILNVLLWDLGTSVMLEFIAYIDDNDDDGDGDVQWALDHLVLIYICLMKSYLSNNIVLLSSYLFFFYVSGMSTTTFSLVSLSIRTLNTFQRINQTAKMEPTEALKSFHRMWGLSLV